MRLKNVKLEVRIGNLPFWGENLKLVIARNKGI